MFENKIKEAIYSFDDRITFIDYTSIDGDFYNSFTIKDLIISISDRYNLNSDLIIRLESYKDVSKIIFLFMNRDYSMIEKIMKSNTYNFSRCSIYDTNLSRDLLISKLIINNNNLFLEGVKLKNKDFTLEINNINSSFSDYGYPDKIDIASIDFKINFIDTINPEDNKIHIDKMFVLSKNKNKSYLLDAFGVSTSFLEKIDINNMSISKLENNDNENLYIEINSLSNDIYINSIKYNFNLSLEGNYDYIDVKYLDIFDKNENIINSNAYIDLKGKTFSSLVKTSNYNILGIRPQQSLINITSSDLEKYNIKFSMYKVSDLVKKTLDRMSGDFFIKCENNICSDYTIVFNENIKITDSHYKGEFELKEIRNIKDFKLQVKSSFIDILKKDRLERVK